MLSSLVDALRLNAQVEVTDNRSVICQIVCSTHGLCHSDLLSVILPHNGINNEMPVFGAWMHLACRIAVW